MMQENALEIKNVERRYDAFTLGPVSLTLPSGCICGLVGENGAGKSTLMRIALGVEQPDAGQAQVLGVDSASQDFVKIKEDIGVVLDDSGFPETMNALQVGRMLRDIYRHWQGDVYGELLRRFNLPEKKAFKDYSRGMRMKLGLAAALSHQPKLLLLDEATSGLDPMAREELLELLGEFAREEGHSIFMASHIVSDLEKLCDYIACIHRGKLLLFEERDALMVAYRVLRLPRERGEEVPPEAFVFRRDGPYGAEMLVRRAMISQAFQTEFTTLEDIVLFMIRAAAGGEEESA